MPAGRDCSSLISAIERLANPLRVHLSIARLVMTGESRYEEEMAAARSHDTVVSK